MYTQKYIFYYTAYLAHPYLGRTSDYSAYRWYREGGFIIVTRRYRKRDTVHKIDNKRHRRKGNGNTTDALSNKIRDEESEKGEETDLEI